MRRRLLVALLAYVVLDFANPMMAGAVQFADGLVQIVQGGLPRVERVAFAVAGPSSRPPIEVGRVLEPPRPTPVRPTRTEWQPVPAPRSGLCRAAPASPTEDH
jgi:hypothetical protein